MTKIHFGSFAWAKQSQGSITWSEKLAMIRLSLAPTLKHISHQLSQQHLNSQQTLNALTFDQVQIPDTPYVQDAVAHVEQQLSPSVLAHSWRSYYWGYALAQRHTLDFDQETFLLSCLFHDTGLGKEHPTDCQCFTLHGALQAQHWAEQQHYPQHKTQVILDSICLHMNGAETPQHVPEVRLLQWGTSCDVIGQQMYQLSLTYQQEVWQHFPAQQFYQEMQRAIDLEASHFPKSRTALLKTLGLPRLMQQFAKQKKI